MRLRDRIVQQHMIKNQQKADKQKPKEKVKEVIEPVLEELPKTKKKKGDV